MNNEEATLSIQKLDRFFNQAYDLLRKQPLTNGSAEQEHRLPNIVAAGSLFQLPPDARELTVRCLEAHLMQHAPSWFEDQAERYRQNGYTKRAVWHHLLGGLASGKKIDDLIEETAERMAMIGDFSFGKFHPWEATPGEIAIFYDWDQTCHGLFPGEQSFTGVDKLRPGLIRHFEDLLSVNLPGGSVKYRTLITSAQLLSTKSFIDRYQKTFFNDLVHPMSSKTYRLYDFFDAILTVPGVMQCDYEQNFMNPEHHNPHSGKLYTAILDMLGIASTNAIAIGDNYNDRNGDAEYPVLTLVSEKEVSALDWTTALHYFEKLAIGEAEGLLSAYRKLQSPMQYDIPFELLPLSARGAPEQSHIWHNSPLPESEAHLLTFNGTPNVIYMTCDMDKVSHFLNSPMDHANYCALHPSRHKE